MKLSICLLMLGLLLSAAAEVPRIANGSATEATASEQSAQQPQTVVPRLVSFNAIVKDAVGKPLSGNVSITFSLYSEQHGGSPLWSEIQTVEAGSDGHYSVFLGGASGSGLPLELFTSGAARWLAVRPDVPGLEDPERILLVGVPYALKAADADMLGGKPASAYLASESPAVMSQAATAAPALSRVTHDGTPAGGGTANFIPIWLDNETLGNSILFQSGSNLGIGTSTPAFPLSLSSTGNTFPAGVSYLSQFVGSGTGTSSGTTNYRGLDFEISATGSNPVQGFTSITGDNINSLSSATLGGQSIFSANLRVNNSGNTTSGYGFQAIPILNAKGGITSWEAFDARTPSVGTAGGIIANAYGIYLEPQQVKGVTTGYGLYQSGTSDTNYLAGNVGIGTKTPGANLEVNGTAKFDGAVTFNGTGGLSLTGPINNSLILQPNVTDTSQTYTSANVIAGFSPGTVNTVASGVTGATISGGGQAGQGQGNSVTDDFGTVAGGFGNTAGAGDGTGQQATVGGGIRSTASGAYSTVSGGGFNVASGTGATLAGGTSNAARGTYATVAGGTTNTASDYATVSGGSNNTASSEGATVAGGEDNTASGTDATVAGGFGNTASGQRSFAAGYAANATDTESFVWCATGQTICNSAGAESFQVSAYGAIYFYDGPFGSGCYLSAGAGSWTCSSDRNLKDHIQTIDPQSVLETLARMPISQWSMKADTRSNKHIGPMAQDFYAAFGLGETDKYIAQGDAQGVALASIQGIYQLMKQKDEKIQKLEERLQLLEKLLLRK